MGRETDEWKAWEDEKQKERMQERWKEKAEGENTLEVK